MTFSQKTTKQIYLAVGLVVLAGLIFWLFKTKHETPKTSETTSTLSQESQFKTTASATKMEKNIWTGILQTSDNPSRGNLMLKTQSRVVYIKTSRDFKSLLGKSVNVSYQGSFESFVLGDITLTEVQ